MAHRHQTIAALRQKLSDQRHAAIAAYGSQPQPERLLAHLSDIADQTLHQLVQVCPLPEHAALAAVGGYGRGELYPYSDVDVLILLADDPDAEAIDAIEHFVAAMWDVGLEPGHSVRTLAQCRQQASQDVTVETALLEARWLAGEQSRITQLLDMMRASLDPGAFFQAKRAEMRQRHAHYQHTPYALEPNCKESPGGLRDLQLLLWVAQAAGYGTSWSDVMRTGALTNAEYRSLRRAEHAFMRVRIELHLLAQRREDRILFDLQPQLAKIYGFQATPTRSASEILMQRYYWAARVVSQLTTILMQSIEEKLFAFSGNAMRLDDDFCIHHGRLDIRREDGFARNPALIFRAFLHVQQHPELTGMTARTLRALWHARRRIDGQFRRNPINQGLFLHILKQKHGVADALYSMTTLNILPRYLPVFRRIVGQMQHDLFHAYTVDEHTLKVIRNLRRFAMPEHAQEYPQASQLMADFNRPWLLYIAALFHDIAKGRGGNHSELGAMDAQRFCRHHRISEDDIELIVFLVRQHLLMSLTAQKKDLSDPHVIHTFTQTVNSKRNLIALYLLTIADIRATSPTVWNSWKGKLLDDLFQRTLIALGGSQPDTGAVLAQRKQQARSEIRALGISDMQCDALWEVLDVAYFLRHEANEITWHTEQIAARLNAVQTIVRARVLGHNEALQVMVYTVDRDDLFSAICQYFDQHTFSVQDARIHTTRHGWALDSFIVLFGQHDVSYQDYIGQVQRELSTHLARPYLNHQPAPRRERRSNAEYRRARAFPILPQVELQPAETSTSWRLSVICADRSGLLYDLSRVFRKHQINLKMAKIHTLGERAEDVFMIESDALLDSRLRLQFERAVLAALNRP